jgi:EmrB/QacA subfamily drug resistance transporter
MAKSTVAVAKTSWFKKWLPLVVLSTALMIIIIDTTVLNVSLKAIVNDLHTNLLGLQWVISAYALTLAAFTITGGRLGDLFGRKKMFMLGAVIFAFGSFITSISHSVGVMIGGEAIIEGLGAALMLPATASLIVATYRGHDRAIAFGVWGGIAGAASAIGPILGGFLTTNYSWRWAFRINIVVALLLLVGSVYIHESRDRAEKQELDIVGVILSALGLLGLVYGIIESSTYGWIRAQQAFALFSHPFAPFNLSVAPIAGTLGLILLVLFALWERRVERRGHTPLVSLKLFKNVQFTAGSLTVALLSLGMVGLIFAVPVFLQSTAGLDALHTGFALIPLSLTVLVVAPLSAVVSKHVPAKYLIQAGMLIAVLASLVLRHLLVPTATAAHLAPGLMLFGLGMGMVMAQASNITLSSVSVEQSGEASGVNNTLRQIGSSFGSAIIGAVVLTTLASGLAGGVVKSRVIPDAVKPQIAHAVSSQASNVELGGASTGANKLPIAVQKELERIAHQASAEASQKAMVYTGLFTFVGFLVSFALPNKKNLAHPDDGPVPASH